MAQFEGSFQGSKYLKFHVLAEKQELQSLFEKFNPFWIYHLSGLSDGASIQPQHFLQVYGSWLDELKDGRIPEHQELRKILAAGFTKEEDAIAKVQAPKKGLYLMKILKPVVQVQAHFFTYSSIDGVFRSQSFGQNSIFWGLEFSYPQIYQDSHTQELLDSKETENRCLFETIKTWVRNETVPTPFVIEGKRVNVPIRLGKGCFSWIHHHPQLKGRPTITVRVLNKMNGFVPRAL